MTARHELPDRPGRAGARKPDLSLALLVFGSAMLAAVVVGFWSGAVIISAGTSWTRRFTRSRSRARRPPTREPAADDRTEHSISAPSGRSRPTLSLTLAPRQPGRGQAGDPLFAIARMCSPPPFDSAKADSNSIFAIVDALGTLTFVNVPLLDLEPRRALGQGCCAHVEVELSRPT